MLMAMLSSLLGRRGSSNRDCHGEGDDLLRTWGVALCPLGSCLTINCGVYSEQSRAVYTYLL